VARLLVLIGATVGGSVGWWLGAFGGLGLAFFVSLVGTALGIFLARRLAREHF
jgi:hypothetical protein